MPRETCSTRAIVLRNANIDRSQSLTLGGACFYALQNVDVLSHAFALHAAPRPRCKTIICFEGLNISLFTVRIQQSPANRSQVTR